MSSSPGPCALVLLVLLALLLISSARPADGRALVAGPRPLYELSATSAIAGPKSPQIAGLADRPGDNGHPNTPRSEGIPAFRLGTVSDASTACPSTSASKPAWLAFDAANQTFWVADSRGCVDVFSLSTYGYPENLSAAIPVGSAPFGVAVDNLTNEIFVSNSGSDNVSVISAVNDTVVASVSVGINPHGIAFDWISNEVYVANTGSNSVTIISPTGPAVVDTVPVGASPVGVVADTTSREEFVANFGSANVTALSDQTHTTVANIPTGNGSYGLAWDNVTNEVFVSNEEASNISVIDTATHAAIAAIPVVDSVQLQGLAYDPATGLVWVGAGAYAVVVVNASTRSLVGYAGVDPAGVAYDPANGAMCVTNTANVTFACLDFRYTSAAIPLTFHESGLPVDFPWSVTLNSSQSSNATTGQSKTAGITFGTAGEYWITYDFHIPTDHGAVATPSQGAETLSGAPVLVNISFTSPYGDYAVTFNETGLPTGTNWSVNLGATTESTASATVPFSEPNGTFHFVVISPPGFSAAPGLGSLQVDGRAVYREVQFSRLPIPLRANFSYQIEGASCLSDGGITNSVVLSAQPAGGSPPYAFNWSLPTGSATTALASTTTTYGQSTAVTLVVSDSAGHSVTHSEQLPMQLPPCPPPAIKSSQALSIPVAEWAIAGLAAALVAVGALAVWLGRRGKGGR